MIEANKDLSRQLSKSQFLALDSHGRANMGRTARFGGNMKDSTSLLGETKMALKVRFSLDVKEEQIS